ncbi:MAG: hypothetical protein A6F71_10870 [Cycloclasticus sp. symbiont of Poecilosclerida sp. M]|nr:MAG: hypothetical protein A6F71_10870 [Cycloclasticus sp. symbiont of Poecilosclerida sp. M]
MAINYQVKEMTNNIVQDLQDKVESAVQQYLCVDVPDLSSCFRTVNPFEELQTEHMQSECHRQHFNLIVSLQWL